MPTTSNTPQSQREQIFEAVKQRFGFVPNLIREFAESPAVAQAYLNATAALASGSLSPKEQQAVQLAVSAHNECHYCTAVHGTAGLKSGLSREDVSAILSGNLPDDERIRHIVQATRLVLDRRGWLEATDLATLEAQGISKAQLYEIIGFVGAKTISNYINHIARTEVDPQFSAAAELPAYRQSTVQHA